MIIKTSELTGKALDWAVDKAEGRHCLYPYAPYSIDPSQAYPIIFREKIATGPDADERQWAASTRDAPCYWVGPTPLVAAMRCHVASRLGCEVDVPDHLCT